METVDIGRTTKLELLDKKLSLMLRMRDLTESADLSGSNAEEQYITLVTRREAIIKQLQALDECLAEHAPEDGEEKLLALIGKVAGQIMEMDSELAQCVPDLLKGIKDRLKQVKHGRSINRAYNADILGTIGNGSFNLMK